VNNGAIADISAWSVDWVWGVPLTVITLVAHVVWLGIFDRSLVHVARLPWFAIRARLGFILVMSGAVLLAVLLHAAEAMFWAIAYVALGALPDPRTAMLFSMEAQTSFAHDALFLAPHWQMLGALEALVGVMMFGLTVAFLFSMMQRVGPANER